MVVAASPSARSWATYAASWSGAASSGAPPSQASRSRRSRLYASTVRGASRAAESARKESTAEVIRLLLSVSRGKVMRPGRDQVASRSGTRVRAVVDLAQPPRIDVAVDLRRREGRMPKKLLDRAQVGAALEQMRRERVPE